MKKHLVSAIRNFIQEDKPFEFSPDIFRLDLSNSNLTDKEVMVVTDALKTSTSLQDLNLCNNLLLKADGALHVVQGLKDSQSLTCLDLSGCGVGNAGVNHLADFLQTNTSLKSLNLRSDKLLSDSGVMQLAESLKVNQSLTRLDLSDTSIESDGATALANALKINTSLQSLILRYNTRFTEQAIKQIASQSLTYLDLSVCKLGKVSALVEALENSQSLTHLDLSACRLISSPVTALAKCLASNTSLLVLNLRDNRIGNLGITELANALKINTSLRTLDLNNAFGHITLSIYSEEEPSQYGRCIAVLADALRFNGSLQDLCLSTFNLSALNHLEDRAAFLLAESLKVNTSLKTLHLDQYPHVRHMVVSGEEILVGGKGVIALAEALKVNNSLQTLNLCGNVVNDRGATLLAEALQVNTSLKDLYLSGSGLVDEGVVQIANALADNRSLTCLTLSHNRVDQFGIQALVEALKVNTSLAYLAFVGNEKELALTEPKKALFKVLQSNTSLVGVVVDCSQETQNFLDKVLSSRPVPMIFGTGNVVARNRTKLGELVDVLKELFDDRECPNFNELLSKGLESTQKFKTFKSHPIKALQCFDFVSDLSPLLFDNGTRGLDYKRVSDFCPRDDAGLKLLRFDSDPTSCDNARVLEFFQNSKRLKQIKDYCAQNYFQLNGICKQNPEWPEPLIKDVALRKAKVNWALSKEDPDDVALESLSIEKADGASSSSNAEVFAQQAFEDGERHGTSFS